MMPVDPKPSQPIHGHKVIVAEHQSGVRPLPAWSLDDATTALMTRWHLTDEERAAIAAGADLWMLISTFGRPVQPIAMGTKGSDLADGWPD
jgi:hypothetical protein